MPLPSYLSAQFTLLYGDPSSAVERQYLQPLYGLTHPPQPAAPGVDMHTTGLYAELPPEGMGPQPVFGGCFLGPDPSPARTTTTEAAAEAAAVTRANGDAARRRNGGRVRFNSDGSPLLASVLADDGSARSLSAARQKYPCPSARSGHVFISCSDTKSILLHGGLEDVSYNDTWKYDVRSGRWTELVCTAAPSTADATSATATATALSDTTVPRPAQRARARQGGAVDADVAAGRYPPCAFGQAGATYHSLDCGASAAPALRLFITGGIQDNDRCNSRSFALDVERRVWEALPLTRALPAMWGSTAGTLRVPRRAHVRQSGPVSQACADGAVEGGSDSNHKGEEEEEEVIIVFGGMSTAGTAVHETFILHLQRALTEEEVLADPAYYLQHIGYDESARIAAHLASAKATAAAAAASEAAAAAGGEPSIALTGSNGDAGAAAAAPFMLPGESAANPDGVHDDEDDDDDDEDTRDGKAAPPPLPVSEEEIEAFRAAHADLLARWRDDALRQGAVGHYLVEVLPPTDGLPGRRRASSCVFRRCFLFMFGGRDDNGYYNDFWVFNGVVRRWVQLRDEVPLFWQRRFFAQPADESAALAIASITAQVRAVRSDPDKNEAKNPLFKDRKKLEMAMFLKQYVHDNLYASPLNSTAKARTGSVMFVDEERNCLYVFGGFTFARGQLWTFCDLHAYAIDHHCWRRVTILPSRPFDLRYTEGEAGGGEAQKNKKERTALQAARDARRQHQKQQQQQQVQRRADTVLPPDGPVLHRVSALLDATLALCPKDARLAKHSAEFESGAGASSASDEEPQGTAETVTTRPPPPTAAAAARPFSGMYPSTHRSTISAVTQRLNDSLRIKDTAPRACTYNADGDADAPSLLGLSIFQYATRYFAAPAEQRADDSGRGRAAAPLPLHAPWIIAPRFNRQQFLSDVGGNEVTRDNARTEYFALPVLAPEARTMAAAAPDPFNYIPPSSSDDEDDGGRVDGERPKRSRGPRRSGQVRFFLHGGRVGEEPRGDLLELRIHGVDMVELDYHQTLSLLDRWVEAQERANNDSKLQQRRLAEFAAAWPHVESTTTGLRARMQDAELPRETTEPAMNTLNSPSNPDLNPLHPPAYVPIREDERVYRTNLSRQYARCAARSRLQLLSEAQRSEERHTVAARGQPGGCSFTAARPHGRHDHTDASDAAALPSTENLRPGTLFHAASRYLRELLDLPARHRGESLSAREFRRNVAAIAEDAWAGASGSRVAAEHARTLHSSERLLDLLLDRLTVPVSAMLNRVAAAQSVCTHADPQSFNDYSSAAQRSTLAQLPTDYMRRGGAVAASFVRRFTAPREAQGRPEGATGEHSGDEARAQQQSRAAGAIASTTVDSPPLTPTAPALTTPVELSRTADGAAAPPAPRESTAAAAADECGASAERPKRSLRYAHRQLWPLLCGEPYYYSGVGPFTLAAPEDTADDATSTAAPSRRRQVLDTRFLGPAEEEEMKTPEHVAHSLAVSLPPEFLSRISLVAGPARATASAA